MAPSGSGRTGRNAVQSRGDGFLCEVLYPPVHLSGLHAAGPALPAADVAHQAVVAGQYVVSGLGGLAELAGHLGDGPAALLALLAQPCAVYELRSDTHAEPEFQKFVLAACSEHVADDLAGGWAVSCRLRGDLLSLQDCPQ